MRLLKIGVYYSTYLAQFYSKRPELTAQPFEVQHTELMYDGFGSSDFWTNALSRLGYETCDIVANAEPLQKMWAKEHNFEFDQSNWLFEITAAQVQAFRPDVLLVADYSTVTAGFLRHLRDICPSIRLIVVWCGAPFRDGSVFFECDIILSCVPELIARFQADGHVSRHVNHAFDPRVLERIDKAALPTSDFTFIGSIVKSDQFHTGREKLISKLVKETDLQIWSDVWLQPTAGRPQDGPSNGGSLARQVFRFIFGDSNTENVDHAVRRRAKAPLFGLEMFKQLHDSRVVLNNHIDISTINASNMRLFEVTGVSACLLTDWKANLATLFEPDSEVVAYRDADDCLEKVAYLLGHDAERREIAAAGHRRTLRAHTFEHRARELDAIIREALISG